MRFLGLEPLVRSESAVRFEMRIQQRKLPAQDRAAGEAQPALHDGGVDVPEIGVVFRGIARQIRHGNRHRLMISALSYKTPAREEKFQESSS